MAILTENFLCFCFRTVSTSVGYPKNYIFYVFADDSMVGMEAASAAADLDSKARCKLACKRVLLGKYALGA